jgi:hypothetical protein
VSTGDVTIVGGGNAAAGSMVGIDTTVGVGRGGPATIVGR